MYPGTEPHLRVAGWTVTAAAEEGERSQGTEFAGPIPRLHPILKIENEASQVSITV